MNVLTRGNTSLNVGCLHVIVTRSGKTRPQCNNVTDLRDVHGLIIGLRGDLLGLSIDSNFAHIAWVRNIEEKFGVKIPFPIIEDLSMNVAHAYGMIQPGASDASAVRATFLIDPEGILRAMVYYPMSNGRSVAEFLRLL